MGMTEQEAIANLKSIQKEYEKKKFGVEALKMSIKALEKQIAKKPIAYNDTNRADCPICGETVRGINKPFGDYCSKCGNKLDWRNKDAE